MTKPKAETEKATPKATASKPAPKQEKREITPASDRRVLEVTDGYRGRPSKEQHIDKGLYLEGDSRLMGIAEVLVEKGHARWLSGVSAATMRQLESEARLPTAALVPDGFRGQGRAEGQKDHGLLTPEEVAAMNTPGWEPEPDRDELGNTLPPAPDGFRGRVVNPDGSIAEAGQEGDQTEYAPEGQRPIIGTSNPEQRLPVPPVVPPDERQRLKKTEG